MRRCGAHIEPPGASGDTRDDVGESEENAVGREDGLEEGLLDDKGERRHVEGVIDLLLEREGLGATL